MVRYSFLVGNLHPRLHAGLSRRLRSLTVPLRLMPHSFFLGTIDSEMLHSSDLSRATYSRWTFFN